MNPPLPKTGISAFFDQELSDSERDEVAELLSNSEVAQRELTQIRQLSDELRGLPTELTSCDFLGEVMNRVERNIPARNSFSRRSIATIGKWLATTAALAVAIVWLPRLLKPTPQADPQNPLIVQQDQPEEESFEENLSVGVPQPKVFTPNRHRIHLGAEGDLITQNSIPESFPKVPPSAATPTERTAPRSQAPLPVIDKSANPLALQSDSVDDSWVSSVMDQARKSEEKVVIVRISTQDAPRMQEKMRSLFAQHSIPQAKTPSLQKRESIRASDMQKANSENTQLGLYVESTTQQLSSVLAKLNQQLSPSNVEPVALASLESIPILESNDRRSDSKDAVEKSKRYLAQVVKPLPNKSIKKKIEPSTSTNQPFSDAHKLNKSTNGNLPSISANPELNNLNIPDGAFLKQEAERKTKSFQMLVQTPTAEDWIEKNLARLKAEESPESQPVDQDDSPPSRTQGEKKRESTTVRVLFLFQPAQ